MCVASRFRSFEKVGNIIVSKREEWEKGEIEMNASVMKPQIPFVTRSELKRTPATLDNRKMAEFLDSHTFSFSVNKESKELRSSVEPKK